MKFHFHCWHEKSRKEYWEDHGKLGKKRTMIDIVTYECCKCPKQKTRREWLKYGEMRKPLTPRPRSGILED